MSTRRDPDPEWVRWVCPKCKYERLEHPAALEITHVFGWKGQVHQMRREAPQAVQQQLLDA